MTHYVFRNINSAFRGMIEEITESPSSDKPMLRGMFSRTPSRNGDVIRWRRPVIIEYERPTERVLFNQARDANPFFHLYESLWMLAGRNDLAPLQYYVSDFGNYSDDGQTLNGAYGYRWRHSTIPGYRREEGIPNVPEGVDQLKILIDHLKHNPTSRRAVLQMWNVESDLLRIGQKCPECADDPAYQPVCKTCKGTGTVNETKDNCCNICCTFEIENIYPGNPDGGRYLNMTVFNRSNDLVFGALGANVCHFSVLQEYMAACIGVEVGTYCQVSSNMHVYLEKTKWKPEKWLSDETPDYYVRSEFPKPFPLVKDPAVFDVEVLEFVEWQHTEGNMNGAKPIRWNEPFINDVASPMMAAFYMHKNRDYEAAMHWIDKIKADDWKIAATSWILKRQKMWEKRNVKA